MKSQSIAYSLKWTYIYWVPDLEGEVHSIWDLWISNLQECKGNLYFETGWDGYTGRVALFDWDKNILIFFGSWTPCLTPLLLQAPHHGVHGSAGSGPDMFGMSSRPISGMSWRWVTAYKRTHSSSKDGWNCQNWRQVNTLITPIDACYYLELHNAITINEDVTFYH